MHMDTVVDDLNDDTLDTWADLQADASTDQNCPLSPFMEKELLRDTDLSMDGGAFIRAASFQYVHTSKRCSPLILNISQVQLS
jgi:hypothetical protein